jgi:hypothetical protein
LNGRSLPEQLLPGTFPLVEAIGRKMVVVLVRYDESVRAQTDWAVAGMETRPDVD